MAIKKSELYSSLWKSCDELRGGMDASQYKDYVLVLLFVKYVSDKYAGDSYAPLVIPEGGSFKDMVALKGKKDIGEGINKIIAELAKANDLKGVIDVADFDNADKLGKGKEMVDRLSNLVGIFQAESHYYNGRRYLLNVIYCNAAPKVEIRNKTYIDLYVRVGSTNEQREKVLTEWYRKQLKDQVPALIAKWQKIIGVEVDDWGVKKMKTKWGTCTLASRRIWLNLELAKKSEPCLEYIIVHEMIHLLERNHSDRFMAYMDKFMPQWRFYKEELNRSMLSHEIWGY